MARASRSTVAGFQHVDAARWGVAKTPHMVRRRAFVAWVEPPRHVGLFSLGSTRAADIDESFQLVPGAFSRFKEPVKLLVDARIFRLEGPLDDLLTKLLRRTPELYLPMIDRIAVPVIVASSDWWRAWWKGIAELRLTGSLVARVTDDIDEAWRILDPPTGLRERVAELTATMQASTAVVARVELELRSAPALDLAALATMLGRPPRSLQRDLAAAGEGFASVRNRVRQRLAEAWLGTSDMKVETIADAVGFASVSHFKAWFQRRSGLSPTGWRARATGATATPAPRR